MTVTRDYDGIDVPTLRRSGAMKWLRHPEDVLGAWISEMDFGTAPAVDAALRDLFSSGHYLGYATPRQLRGVSEACAVWQERDFGVRFDPDLIHPVSDIIKAFEIALGFYTRPGSAVIVPTPGYLSFLQVPAAFDREVIEVPMLRDGERWVYDLEAIDQAFAGGAQLLALCNPHNPLGLVHTRDELAAISEVVERHGGRVFADELHAPFVFAPHEHVPYVTVSDAAAAHTITATSASKGWNVQGLKCAQILFSNEADEDLWRPIGLPQTLTASIPGLVAAEAAYLHGGPWLDDVMGYLTRNRLELVDLMQTFAPGVRWDVPDGTYMAFLDCSDLGLPASMTATEFFLERARVAFNNGEKFGAAGAGHVRLNFATPLPILEQVVERAGRAIDSWATQGAAL